MDGRWEFWIDRGGTFTDVVCLYDQQRLCLAKVPTTPHDLVHGVRQKDELAYHDLLVEHLPSHEFLGDMVREQLLYYPTVTREAYKNMGRVTELMARPLLCALFPQLARFVQPLAGEYAGRREMLEAVPFVEGWGVELGLLIDVVARFGRDAVAQVDLGTREHRNRPVDALAAQSLSIIAVALRA